MFLAPGQEREHKGFRIWGKGACWAAFTLNLRHIWITPLLRSDFQFVAESLILTLMARPETVYLQAVVEITLSGCALLLLFPFLLSCVVSIAQEETPALPNTPFRSFPTFIADNQFRPCFTRHRPIHCQYWPF